MNTITVSAAQFARGYWAAEGATVSPRKFRAVGHLADGRVEVLDPGPRAFLDPPPPVDVGWAAYLAGKPNRPPPPDPAGSDPIPF